jgi:hypothetical protein
MKKFWSKLFGKKSLVTDRDRIRLEIVAEVEMATQFAQFVTAAFNRGYAGKITVEVDGVTCEVGVLCGTKEGLFEYLANWACAEKIRKQVRLEQFDKEVGEGYKATMSQGGKSWVLSREERFPGGGKGHSEDDRPE